MEAAGKGGTFGRFGGRLFMKRLMLPIILVVVLAGCMRSSTVAYQPVYFKASETVAFLQALSADDMAGRKTGSDGYLKAQALIVSRMEGLQLMPFDGTYRHPFEFSPLPAELSGPGTAVVTGVNLAGFVQGAGERRQTIIIGAHYDHLGTVSGAIYNGADDNASGVAGMLAMAEYFQTHKPYNDFIFVAFDAEEYALDGSKHFVANTLDPDLNIALNINLDMIARGETTGLWVSGVAHNPSLGPMVRTVAAQAPVRLRLGYDTEAAGDDWTLLSDHGPFFLAGIPHLYLGVEDHADYHQPTDQFERIDLDWYLRSVDTVIMMGRAADAELR